MAPKELSLFYLPTGEKDLFDVLAELMLVVGRWKAIGEGLRLDLGTLEQIETMDNRNPRNCMSATLKQWLRRNYDVEQFGEPTWRAVVKVVGHSAAGNNCALAMSIAGKHAGITYKCIIMGSAEVRNNCSYVAISTVLSQTGYTDLRSGRVQ